MPLSKLASFRHTLPSPKFVPFPFPCHPFPCQSSSSLLGGPRLASFRRSVRIHRARQPGSYLWLIRLKDTSGERPGPECPRQPAAGLVGALPPHPQDGSLSGRGQLLPGEEARTRLWLYRASWSALHPCRRVVSIGPFRPDRPPLRRERRPPTAVGGEALWCSGRSLPPLGAGRREGGSGGGRTAPGERGLGAAEPPSEPDVTAQSSILQSDEALLGFSPRLASCGGVAPLSWRWGTEAGTGHKPLGATCREGLAAVSTFHFLSKNTLPKASRRFGQP